MLRGAPFDIQRKEEKTLTHLMINKQIDSPNSIVKKSYYKCEKTDTPPLPGNITVRPYYSETVT